MKKKAYIILTTVLLLISPILYRPFKISANQSLSAPFVGVNVYLIDRDTTQILNDFTLYNFKLYCSQQSSNGNYCHVYRQYADGDATIDINANTSTSNLYKYEFILDNNYVGSITWRYQLPTGSYTNVTSYVNGSSFDFTILQGTAPSVQIVSYDLSRIETNSWVFPVESFTTIKYVFDQGFQQVGIDNHTNYYFPIFQNDSTKSIFNVSVLGNSSDEWIMILGCSNVSATANLSRFTQNFTLSSGIEITSYNSLYVSSSYRIISIKFNNPTSSTLVANLKCNLSNTTIMPIYVNRTNNLYLSTDFALTYGLKNELINNLNIIASGTPQSQDSVNNSDTTNQQAAQTFAQEEQLVNNAEEDLQDNLDALDIQNQNNNLFGNSKFVASAQWVKLQFDNLTYNNAFGYMITFSLVIGLALVIVGKLRG